MNRGTPIQRQPFGQPLDRSPELRLPERRQAAARASIDRIDRMPTQETFAPPTTAVDPRVVGMAATEIPRGYDAPVQPQTIEPTHERPPLPHEAIKDIGEQVSLLRGIAVRDQSGKISVNYADKAA
ncbi:hypothetical protein CR983_02560 [Candidatus Saccharibacteria bacterium]|nr:MAG: hypothetical protein CR983_02560 [Candidatus Saccharibacteria bacterium]